MSETKPLSEEEIQSIEGRMVIYRLHIERLEGEVARKQEALLYWGDRAERAEGENKRLRESFAKIARLTETLPDDDADLANDWHHIRAVANDPLGLAALKDPP